MATVNFRIEGGDAVKINVEGTENLFEAALRAGIALDAPCGRNGTCGKCRVRVLAGDVAFAVNQHLSEEDAAAGWRLACQSKVSSDAEVFIPEQALAYKTRIRITDITGEREKKAFEKLRADMKAGGFLLDHGLEAAEVELVTPTVDDAVADRERLLAALSEKTGIGQEKLRVTLAALKKMPGQLRGSDFKAVCILRRDEDGGAAVINIFSRDAYGKAKHPVAGLAIDIGTTTISMLLVDLLTGDPISGASCGNGQIRYGADVINRIIAASKKGGLEKLRRAVAEESIALLIRRLCLEAGIRLYDILRVTIAGNTTMSTLFLGVPSEFIRLEPYVPPFFHGEVFTAGSLRLPVNSDAEVLLAPSVGSYVGGDITAGVFSAGFYREEPLTLFIDLGTNGEIVFGNAEFMMGCACSAGPAFEGGEISCGMRATTGAIEACTIDEATGEPSLSVIGSEEGAKPDGLCGSGLIDIIAELFRCKIIDARGKISGTGKRITQDEYGGHGYIVAFGSESAGGNDIVLNEVDLDNFIRAKGAIFSAIRTMLEIAATPVEAIERVFVAGGIGSGINIQNAIRIGMFPKLEEEKYTYIGNSSLTGSYAMLCSKGAAGAVAGIANSITYLELSSHPGYMDEFVASCFIPHTDSSLFE